MAGGRRTDDNRLYYCCGGDGLMGGGGGELELPFSTTLLSGLLDNTNLSLIEFKITRLFGRLENLANKKRFWLILISH